MADLVQNAVGENLYVWSKCQGKPSPDANGRCIISADGAQSYINSRFPIQDVELVFYAPHGSDLYDPGLYNILTGKKQPTEVVAGGNCQDYVLSKFQEGAGPGRESYESIGGMGNRSDALAQISRNMFDDAASRGDGDTFWKAALSLDKYTNWMDVVTVRNRKLKSNPTLSEVIKALHDAGYRYTTIHCVFCRGSRLPWKSSPMFEAQDAP